MKLKDFTSDVGLNVLRTKMGLQSGQFGKFVIDPRKVDPDTREKLFNGGDVRVAFSDITILPDQTLAYKDVRIFLYIRDVREHIPKFHLMNCATVRTMRDNGRIDRFVNVSAQGHKIFSVNLPTPSGTICKEMQLDVCQNCLAETAFEGFSHDMQTSARLNIVREFDPQHFFKLYPRNLHVDTPRYSWENSPVDEYTSDFPAISLALREKANWTCSGCRRNFSDQRFRKFLHVHHISAVRSNNSPENLRVLCIGCHAKQFNHSHLRNTPSFKQFAAIFDKDSSGTPRAWEAVNTLPPRTSYRPKPRRR